MEPEPFEFAMRVLDELATIESEVMRKRCFLLAVDVAMASGGITETEDRALEKMAEVLRLDEASVRVIAEVMAIKYAG